MTSAKTANQARLDERYGRTPAPRWVWALLGTIVTAIFLWFAWGAITHDNAAVRVDDLGYEVVDDHTATVRFQVSAPANREVACMLEALDELHGVVGFKTEVLPASPERIRGFSASIPTLSQATTAIASLCWVVTDAGN